MIQKKDGKVSEENAKLQENVYAALCDDLNKPIALSYLFEAVKIVNTVKDGKMEITSADKEILENLFINIVDGVLGITDEVASNEGSSTDTKILDGLINMVLEERKVAKANKDWAKSDKIRDNLKEIGVNIKDTKDGVEWSI